MTTERNFSRNKKAAYKFAASFVTQLKGRNS
jgi:hypothetical protein